MSHALLIDGENIASRHARTLLDAVPADCLVRRVYGNLTLLNGWLAVPDLCAVHTPTASNAADIRLAIDAVETFHRGVRHFTIASGDSGLASLATHLREGGARITVFGRPNTPAHLRVAAHEFFTLDEVPHMPVLATEPEAARQPKPPKPELTNLERLVVELLTGAKGAGVLLTAINGAAHKQLGVHIGSLSEKTWHKWIEARSDLFSVDPRGPNARVRLASLPTR